MFSECRAKVATEWPKNSTAESRGKGRVSLRKRGTLVKEKLASLTPRVPTQIKD